MCEVRIDHILEDIRNKRELEILKNGVEINDIFRVSNVNKHQVIQESRYVNRVH